jgi:hypothetical protein
MRGFISLLLSGFVWTTSNAAPIWSRFMITRSGVDDKSYIKISPDSNNGPPLSPGAQFGYSMTAIGDIDGNGFIDLAVGAYGESYYSRFNDSKSVAAGAVYILMMASNMTVASYYRVSGELFYDAKGQEIEPWFRLFSNDNFGYSVANLGDIDGDGITDIAVGAPGVALGNVFVLFLNSSGIVRSVGRITDGAGGGPQQRWMSRFGATVASIGDFDGDSIPDMAVTSGDADSGSSRIFIMYLYRNGTCRNFSSVGFGLGGGPPSEEIFTSFGSSIATLGDLNGDNVTDFAIGAKYNQDSGGAASSGAVYICFMNSNGTINKFIKHGDVVPLDVGGAGVLLDFYVRIRCCSLKLTV